MKTEIQRKLSCKICSSGIFSKGLKNEFKTAVVKEPSVFESLKFYCTYFISELSKNSILIFVRFENHTEIRSRKAN